MRCDAAGRRWTMKSDWFRIFHRNSPEPVFDHPREFDPRYNFLLATPYNSPAKLNQNMSSQSSDLVRYW